MLPIKAVDLCRDRSSMSNQQPGTFSVVYSKAMETFFVVCQHRSFTKAAAVLGLSQSAVSQNIQALEDMLGFTLFVRSMRPVGLTPEALVLKAQLEKHAAEISDTLLRARQDNSLKPAIRAAVVESLSPNIAPALVQSLAARSTHISILTGTSDVIVAELLQQDVDLVISSNPYHEIDGLNRYFLFEEPHVLVLPLEMAVQRQRWTWEELQYCGRPVVRYSAQSSSGKTIEALFQRVGLNLPLKFEVDTSRVLFSLVASGLGWAVTTPLCLLQCADMLPRLAILPAPAPLHSREIYVLTRKGESDALARLVLNICAQQLRDTVVTELLAITPWAKGHLRVSEKAV